MNERVMSEGQASEVLSRVGQIGRCLVANGSLSQSDLARVMSYQRERGVRFGEAAVALGLVTRPEVDAVIRQQFAYPLAVDGRERLDPALEAAFHPDSPRVEALRSLRAELMLRHFDEPERRILPVLGLDPGRTLGNLTANLAVVFSQLGASTVLIDADLRAPRLHRLFGLDNPQGLSDALAGRTSASPRQCAPFHSLYLLNGGTAAPNPQELLSGERYQRMGRELAESYDVVLVNTPSLADNTDGQVIAVRAGAALLLAQQGRTPYNRLAGVSGRLRSLGVTLVGATLCH